MRAAVRSRYGPADRVTVEDLPTPVPGNDEILVRVHAATVGGRVFGTTAPRFGAHAEYVCLSEQAAVEPMPAGLGYPEAASLADATPTSPAAGGPMT